MARTPTTRTKSTDVVESVQGDMLPDFMRDEALSGLAGISADDTETPRIKLLQGVSPEVEEFDNAKSGQFWHTLQEISLGDTIRVVPIFVDVSAILWRPRWDGGGILARTSDMQKWNPSGASFQVKPIKGDATTVTYHTRDSVAASKLLEWGSSVPTDPNSAPAATRMYNLVLVFPDNPEITPAVVTLQRSSIRVARKLLGKMKVTRAPIYGTVFEMSRIKDTNPSGDDFWNYRFTGAGFVTDEGQYKEYKKLHEHFAKDGIKIRDEEGLQDDDTPSGPDAGSSGDHPEF